MAQPPFAAGLAALLALQAPLPALAQDLLQAEDVQSDPAEEIVVEEYEYVEYDYSGDDPDDPLYADDEFNASEFDAIEDDAVGVETGRDQIPDVYELFDEDGDSSFDEDLDVDDDVFDESGLFHDELPILRKPSGGSEAPMARQLPAVPAGQAAAWPDRIAVHNRFAGKLPALTYSYRTGSIWRAEGSRTAGGTAALARPSVLAVYGGIFVPLQLTPRASAVYMVSNNGAPFQAAIRRASHPKTWTPTSSYRAFARYQDWEARHVCGGSLIDSEWVLTAAHCLWSVSDGYESRAEASMAKGLTVLLGAEDISRPLSGSNYVVDKVIIHGGFNPRNIYRHDIALLHIVPRGAPSRLNVISSIRLHAAAEPRDHTGVSVMGWGKSRDETGMLAQTALWRADVKLIAAARCRTLPNMGRVTMNGRVIEKIGPTSLCAGESVGKACSGDSGGPLIFTDNGPMLVGIVSWTVEDSCGRPAIPNVYTRVAGYTNWINAAMGNASDPASGVVYLPE